MSEKAIEVIAETLKVRYGTTTTWATHILAALKAARIAVVELPEPNSFNSYPMLWAGETESAIPLSNGEVRVSGFDDMTSEVARDIAAAVLAAANAAEAVSDE